MATQTMEKEQKAAGTALATKAESALPSATEIDMSSLLPTPQLMEFANMMAKWDGCPRGLKNKPEDIALTVLMGREIGLAPMQSIQGLAVINGVPSAWGPTLMAVIQAHPICEYIYTEWDEDKKTAYCIGKRADSPFEERKEFSEADAIKAGLMTKDTYKNYPKDMIMWKAVGRMGRTTFADVTKGVAIREEAELYRMSVGTNQDEASDLVERVARAKSSTRPADEAHYEVLDDEKKTEPEPKAEPRKAAEPKKAKPFDEKAFIAYLDESGVEGPSWQTRICQMALGTDYEYPDHGEEEKRRVAKVVGLIRSLHGEETDITHFLNFAHDNGLAFDSPAAVREAYEQFENSVE